jgi:hypothetical protein
MAADEKSPATPEHMHSLAAQLIGFLRAPAMLRNSPKAALLFIYMQRDDMTDELKATLINATAKAFEALERVEQRNVAHGLSEVRKALGERDPGPRKAGAVSLWEQLIAKLPQDMHDLAREGEIE